MKHTIKLLTLAAILTAVFGLTGCPGPVNNYIEPTHEHVFGDWSDWEVVTAATCTENGSKKRTRTCSCGEVEEETAVIAAGHNFGEWEITENPTCTTNGSKTRTCSRCNHTETEEIPALGHDYQGGYCERCHTHEYNGENGYHIVAYIYSNLSDAQADNENRETAYFSFPKDNALLQNISEIEWFSQTRSLEPYITIENLLHFKTNYINKTVTHFGFNVQDIYELLPNDITGQIEPEKLSNLVQNSPIYIVIE